jgi:hypothetical protein
VSSTLLAVQLQAAEFKRPSFVLLLVIIRYDFNCAAFIQHTGADGLLLVSRRIGICPWRPVRRDFCEQHYDDNSRRVRLG